YRRSRPASFRGAPRESADRGRVDEGLVAEMVVLPDEGLEGAEPVGIAGRAGLDLDVEVAPQVGEMALERRDVERRRQAPEDLVHGEETTMIAENGVHGVVRDG